MENRGEKKRALPSSGAAALAVCLTATAVIVTAAACAAGAAQVILAARAGRITVGVILAAAASVVGGLAVACLLWATAWTVRSRRELLSEQRRMASILAERRPANGSQPAPVGTSPPGGLADVTELLRGVLAELRRLKADVMLRPGGPGRAGGCRRDRPANGPAGGFEQASAAARPGQAEAFELQQRRELYARIERHVDGRRWRAAAEAARELLAAHPGSPEADLVAARIDMLEDNARIEQVRGMRDRIIELIRRRRYAEAIRLGREVIDNFPDTVAAGDLRRQLPRLVRLAGPGRGDINSETQYLGDILAELAEHGGDGLA